MSKESLCELWDTIMQTNIFILGVPKEEQRGKGAESLVKDIIAENCPNLGRDMDIQVQGTQRSPSKINPKKITLKHIKIMLNIKVKERSFKGLEFSAENLETGGREMIYSKF